VAHIDHPHDRPARTVALLREVADGQPRRAHALRAQLRADARTVARHGRIAAAEAAAAGVPPIPPTVDARAAARWLA
jgi:hypothetical protein